MDVNSILATAGAAFTGLVIGYFMGYFNGKVAGELKAIKGSRTGRRRNHESRTENGVE